MAILVAMSFVLFNICTIVATVYVPPDANANLAMKVLSATISKPQRPHSDGALIVAADLNHTNLRTVLSQILPICFLSHGKRLYT